MSISIATESNRHRPPPLPSAPAPAPVRAPAPAPAAGLGSRANLFNPSDPTSAACAVPHTSFSAGPQARASWASAGEPSRLPEKAPRKALTGTGSSVKNAIHITSSPPDAAGPTKVKREKSQKEATMEVEDEPEFVFRPRLDPNMSEAG
ncbi:hypothetical protein I316_08037 [Kwoniella heveanensis BCC8398]|uniref:Uncharacterized protein n=1 Tax=Kwoniella heveanensis BCC8398 TaxID=1296120 RepID=A0A1B9GGX2_9TREE|nr:hypothetical protein I316_08037 [Kwoniella heveanensis BCC8398]